MKYALPLYHPGKQGPVLQEMMGKYMRFVAALGSRRIGGAGLKAAASATTVRTSGGAKTIHDGPFAETKEQLGGRHLIDVPDLDAAIAIAKKIPSRRRRG